MRDKKNTLIQISDMRREISKAEYDNHEINSKIKSYNRTLDDLLIDETVSDLLKVQEEEGKLDEFVLVTFLKDLATKIRR